MAPEARRQLFPARDGRTDLRDTLGAWLIGDAQERLSQAAEEVRTAHEIANQRTIERDLASQAWRDQLMRTEDISNGFEVSLQGRDRLCTSLMHLVLLYATKLEIDETSDTRIGICTRYFEELRTFADEHHGYAHQLTPLDTIRDNVDDELAAEALVDMPTDPDSGSETETDAETESEDDPEFVHDTDGAMDIDEDDMETVEL